MLYGDRRYLKYIGTHAIGNTQTESGNNGRWEVNPCNLDKYKGCLGYATMKATTWIATSADGGVSWYATLHDKSKGPVGNTKGQQVKEITMEVVKV